MAGHSTWRVTGSRITGAVPEEVRAGQSRPPDLACTGADAVQRPVPPRREFLVHRVGDLADQAGGIDGGDPGVRLLAVPAGEDLGELGDVAGQGGDVVGQVGQPEVPGDHQDVRDAGQESGQAPPGQA